MPEIRPEPEDIILEKLSKIKCSMKCQNTANYLIFGHGKTFCLLTTGLYCSSCLSEIKDTTPDQLINFESLSQHLVTMVEAYEKSTKGELSHYKVAKTETDKANSAIKKLRDTLNFESKSTRTKSYNLLEEGYRACLKEFTLEELEALYEPNLTATSIINEKELLLANLNILSIDDSEENISYSFRDKKKDPAKKLKECDKDYKEIRKCLESAYEQSKGIIENFKKQVKPSEKATK